MPPRADRQSSAYVELSWDERAALNRMKELAGVATDPNLLRIALWSLGDHYDLDMPDGVFDLREGQGKTQRNPRVRQHDDGAKTIAALPDSESFVCGKAGK